MTIKLNLTVKNTTVKKAKAYALKNNTSVSKLVNDYLETLTTKATEKASTSFTKMYGGTLTHHIPNIEEAKDSYLRKKYGI